MAMFCSSSFSLAPAVMDGQTVTRWWKGMSRKQREESPWSCNQRWSSPSTTTTWSCVWTPTLETPGSPSSGSTVSSADCPATHRRTRTSRKSAPVGDRREFYILEAIFVTKSTGSQRRPLFFYLTVSERRGLNLSAKVTNNNTNCIFSPPLFSLP